MNHSFTWSTRREGNSGYVLETHPDGSDVEFGPMPAHVVPHFVNARRRYVHHMMQKVGATLTEDTTTTPPPDAFRH